MDRGHGLLNPVAGTRSRTLTSLVVYLSLVHHLLLLPFVLLVFLLLHPRRFLAPV